MADEPENHTIRLLREMREENAAFRKEIGERFDKNDRQIQELGIAVAALSVDLKGVKESVDDLGTRMEIVEGRLNTIDGRLARIEKHTGLVKA